MSKSIASKTLAIAKRQEAERLKDVKEDFLDIMRKNFEERQTSCDPWTAVGDSYYIFAETFKDFKLDALKVVCEDVGFNLKYEWSVGHKLSIPEWVKGQKRTQAQLMLYWSNIEIKREIKRRKESARKMCKEAFEKIKKGDFVEEKYRNGYECTVKMSYSESNREFKDEVSRIFDKKKLWLLSIEAESGEWKFLVKDNDEEN